MITSKFIIILDYSVKEAWDIIAENSDYHWRSDLKNISIIDNNNFIEIDKSNFETNFKITNMELYKQYEFDMTNKNISGHWIGIFKELNDNKCELELIENIQISNIIMRLFGKMYLKKQQNRYVKDLIKRLGQ